MLKTKRDLYISVGVICIFLIPDHLLVTLIVGSKSVNFKSFLKLFLTSTSTALGW